MMRRTVTTTALALIALTTFATTADPHAADVARTMITATPLPNLPGHTLTAVTVELAPGVTVPAHRHDGFVFVYVLDGAVRSQLDDGPPVDYPTGAAWVEPPGTLHTLTQNLSPTDRAKVLAVFVAEDGAALTTPDDTID